MPVLLILVQKFHLIEIETILIWGQIEMKDCVNDISNNIKYFRKMWRDETIGHSLLVTGILLLVLGVALATAYVGIAKFGFPSSQPVSTLSKEKKEVVEQEKSKNALSNSFQDSRNASNENILSTIQKNKTIITIDPFIVKELHDKNLFEELDRANNRLPSKNDIQARLNIYRDVLNQLSPEAHDRLDKTLLNSARNDYLSGDSSNAVEKYKQLFSK